MPKRKPQPGSGKAPAQNKRRKGEKINEPLAKQSETIDMSALAAEMINQMQTRGLYGIYGWLRMALNLQRDLATDQM